MTYILYGPTPRRWIGALRKVRYIVIHTTEGTDSRSWGLNPNGAGWHYLVREEGVYQFSPESDAAWHAGVVSHCGPTSPLITLPNPNLESIGIEFEGYHNRPLSDRLIALGASLIRDIRSRHGQVPLVKHSDIDTCNRRDPGEDNFARLQRALEEELDEARIREIAKEEARAVLSQEAWLPDAIEAAVEKALQEASTRLGAPRI